MVGRHPGPRSPAGRLGSSPSAGGLRARRSRLPGRALRSARAPARPALPHACASRPQLARAAPRGAAALPFKRHPSPTSYMTASLSSALPSERALLTRRTCTRTRAAWWAAGLGASRRRWPPPRPRSRRPQAPHVPGRLAAKPAWATLFGLPPCSCGAAAAARLRACRHGCEPASSQAASARMRSQRARRRHADLPGARRAGAGAAGAHPSDGEQGALLRALRGRAAVPRRDILPPARLPHDHGAALVRPPAPQPMP